MSSTALCGWHVILSLTGGMADPKYSDVVTFMATVKAKLGATSANDLAARLVELGAIEQREWRKVPKWVKGENKPDHYATLALLGAAGMLTDDGVQPDAAKVTLARQAAQRLAAEAETLAALLLEAENG